MAGPLAGIKVLDFTIAAAGPYAGVLLGELGASVLRIDRPNGDGIARHAPLKGGMSTTYPAVNLNKRCAILDLKSEEGKRVARALAADTDVIIENHRSGTLERLGLGYEDIYPFNPRVVYCSSSGYGVRGPLAGLASIEWYAQAIGGWASLNGVPETRGEILRQPQIDLSTSQAIVESVLAGLYVRERTGCGQKLETSQLQVTVWHTLLRSWRRNGRAVPPQPAGSHLPPLVPCRSFGCADGRFIAVVARDDQEWRALAMTVGDQALSGDPRFAGLEQRTHRREELEQVLQERFQLQPAAEWLRLLAQAGVPSGPYLEFTEIYNHPQVVANKMLTDVQTPWGRLRVTNVPWQFEKTPAAVGNCVVPGADTDEVIAEVGVSHG